MDRKRIVHFVYPECNECFQKQIQEINWFNSNMNIFGEGVAKSSFYGMVRKKSERTKHTCLEGNRQMYSNMLNLFRQSFYFASSFIMGS